MHLYNLKRYTSAKKCVLENSSSIDKKYFYKSYVTNTQL